MKASDVVNFWQDAGPLRWFTRDSAFDGALAIRFGGARKEARSGAFDDWAETPGGAMGLVILLDQMSRNIHRGTPLAFAADAKALALANSSIARGFHQKFPAPRAMWFLMPLEHAENIDAQHRCVALFQATGMHDLVRYARIHLDIIARFGRFPHRNPILGRISTEAELHFLRTGGFSG